MLVTCLTGYAQETEAPSMALLEFLGEGIKVEQEIVDPVTWQAIETMTGREQDSEQQTHD